MATRENVTAARLTKVVITTTIKSADVTPNTRTVVIHESICSPYITAEITILDNNNTLANLGIEGGARVDVEFDGVSTKAYVIDLYVLDMKGENSPENLDLKIYTMSLVTSEYFTDQGKRTPETTKIMDTGVTTVRKIWSDAGFLTPLIQMPTDLPIQNGDTPLTIGLMKPFTAISQVRDIQVYPDRTGNVLLFRAAKAVYHTTLHEIYSKPSVVETLQQSQIWGADYKNMFIGSPADRAIISLINVSRTTMLDPKQFAPTATRSADDISKGKMNINEASGALGADAGHALMNSNKTSAEIDHTTIMNSARAYAICLKAQPQFIARVPIQSGINITVGNSVKLNLFPTTTDGTTQLLSPLTGDYLVTDLTHEIHGDLREVLGTTNLQCLKTAAPCAT